MLRSLHASESVGVRVLLVHAKHEEARGWYEQYGFERSPTDRLHLMLLMKDRKTFVEARSPTDPLHLMLLMKDLKTFVEAP